MKFLVTGAGGQVGSALGLMGPLNGHEVIPLDRQTLDITGTAEVRAAISNYNPDAVINTAAYTAVDKAQSEPELALAINAAGPENLALACADLDIPLLHISTDFVFDGKKSEPYSETDPIGPLSVYGSSKAEGEARVAAIGGKFLILRTAWVFGGEQNFVATMLRLGETMEELNIVDDQRGGPTASTDIAAALLSMAEQANAPAFSDWGIYHYSGAPSLTWFGFAQAIFAGRDKPVLHPIPTKDYPTPAARPKNSVLDCSKIKRVFDIDQPDWRTALSQLLT
ncbi:dTDP-4-dehydrorhamnose reductase [Sneathiella marina]|uniref:dTDP-4-dehydrorhamnose reductase n=1 Tax=Sneathiella marina TaxID=2950108 RepID=A0ABY4W969_9PROT|nr:dTDP-4-dehydrorhamnose reductase [Sneathiella marina]USG62663.1 dTDP-4-dehydrorhamnose reductase [Sneathiella marina]